MPRSSQEKFYPRTDLGQISNFYLTLISPKSADFAKFWFENGTFCTHRGQISTKKESISYNTRRHSGGLKDLQLGNKVKTKGTQNYWKEGLGNTGRGKITGNGLYRKGKGYRASLLKTSRGSFVGNPSQYKFTNK